MSKMKEIQQWSVKPGKGALRWKKEDGQQAPNPSGGRSKVSVLQSIVCAPSAHHT